MARITRLHAVVVLLVGVSCITLYPARAETRYTQEEIVARTLAKAVEFHLRQKKTIPASWQELEGYIDFKNVEKSLGRPVKEAFSLDRRDLKGNLPAEMDGKEIIALSKVAGPRKHTAIIGRHVLVLGHDNTVRAVWLDEKQVQSLLGSKDMPRQEAIPEQIRLHLEVTNPDRELIPGEPISLCVRALAGKNEGQVIPRFAFEVELPGGDHIAIPLCGLHFLSDSISEYLPDAHVNTTGQREWFFYVLLWLVPSDGKYETDQPRIVTARPGHYRLRVREMAFLSQSETVGLEVKPLDNDGEAYASFTSTRGVRAFLGDDKALEIFERLVKEHRQSKYASIASAIIGIHRFARLQEQMGKADAEVLDQLVRSLEDATTLGYKSLLDLRATYARAVCTARLGRTAISNSDYEKIVREYHELSALKEVKEATKALASTEK